MKTPSMAFLSVTASVALILTCQVEETTDHVGGTNALTGAYQ